MTQIQNTVPIQCLTDSALSVNLKMERLQEFAGKSYMEDHGSMERLTKRGSFQVYTQGTLFLEQGIIVTKDEGSVHCFFLCVCVCACVLRTDLSYFVPRGKLEILAMYLSVCLCF
jgi:hypothetical protein